MFIEIFGRSHCVGLPQTLLPLFLVLSVKPLGHGHVFFMSLVVSDTSFFLNAAFFRSCLTDFVSWDVHLSLVFVDPFGLFKRALHALIQAFHGTKSANGARFTEFHEVGRPRVQEKTLLALSAHIIDIFFSRWALALYAKPSLDVKVGSPTSTVDAMAFTYQPVVPSSNESSASISKVV